MLHYTIRSGTYVIFDAPRPNDKKMCVTDARFSLFLRQYNINEFLR
jgi:hypothetical protein